MLKTDLFSLHPSSFILHPSSFSTVAWPPKGIGKKKSNQTMNTTKSVNQRILGNAQKVFLAASLAVLLGITAMSANADEFTVGHSGADVAWRQYGLDGQGITVAIVDSAITSNH